MLNRKLIALLFFLPLSGIAAPSQIQPIPLFSGANTAFADERANDRKGGWTDQGSNDLRIIKPGLIDVGGIPFEILSDNQTNGKSCIVLGDKKHDYMPKRAKITPPAGLQGKVLYLLHSGAWLGKNESMAGKLTVTYANNERKEFHIRVGRDINDWWGHRSASNAVRCWSQYNNNNQVSLYVSKFALKELPLAAIDFESDNSTWMIVALSVGSDMTPAPLPLDWQLHKDYTAVEPVDAKVFARPISAKLPRNIIMIIGDGMGQGSLRLASLAGNGMPGKLLMEQLPVHGLVQTYSADSKVTDSAAAGTALSCGCKTKNGMLGMNPDNVSLRTIAEAARDAGKSVGMITTDYITGATPAAYMVHVPSRGMTQEIADAIAVSRFDILVGETHAPFRPKSEKDSCRKDERNLLREMQTSGYAVCNSPEEFMKAKEGKVIGAVSTWLQDFSLLGKITNNALERLNKNPNGFFVMIESSYPDSGGHSNNPDLSVAGVLICDYAARVALIFAAQNGDTLIVVTADHETGGIQAAANQKNSKRPYVYYNETSHTGALVEVFAYGPGADAFAGIIENTDIPKIFAKYWNLKIGEQSPVP